MARIALFATATFFFSRQVSKYLLIKQQAGIIAVPQHPLSPNQNNAWYSDFNHNSVLEKEPAVRPTRGNLAYNVVAEIQFFGHQI